MNIAERFAWLRAVAAAEPRSTVAELAVAITLAEHFNVDRGAAWPSQQTIADLTRMDRRSVRRGLETLEQRGLVRRLTNGGPRSSAKYTLVLPPDGAPQRREQAPKSTASWRPSPPSEGGRGRPEQVSSRSEAAGNTYPAASVRSPYGSRTRSGAGGGARKARPAHSTTEYPITL